MFLFAITKFDKIKDELYMLYQINSHLSNKQICYHFVAIGYNERSVFRWIKILRGNGDLKRKPESGRPVKIATKGNISKI